MPFIDLLSLKYSLYTDKNVFWVQWWVPWQSFRVYPVWEPPCEVTKNTIERLKTWEWTWYKIHLNNLLPSLSTFENHYSVCTLSECPNTDCITHKNRIHVNTVLLYESLPLVKFPVMCNVLSMESLDHPHLYSTKWISMDSIKMYPTPMSTTQIFIVPQMSTRNNM